MSIITKKWKWIILIILIALISSSIYILKSGSEKFAILDIDNLSSLNSPGLKLAVEATEECNKLEAKYKEACYTGIAWESGYYYENTVCENLNQGFKHFCYQGYGENIGEKYSPNINIIQDECFKTNFYEECLSFAARGIGSESSKDIETEQCQEFEHEDAKQRCYNSLGRQLARDNKEQSLCKKVKNEEACLLGFAYGTDTKGSRKEALQICTQLNEAYAKRCYNQIGECSISVYNQTIKDAFKDCEKNIYLEDCKIGVIYGITSKFFEENQKKNEETDSVTTPAMFAIYKIKNIVSTIKQKIILPFINHKLTYLTIILLSIGMILAVRALRNKKVQKVIKRLCEGIRTTTQKVYYISIKKLFITYNFSTEIILQIYKKLKIIIQDVLSIDKTTITSFSKELKTELGSKEGKKRL